MNISKKYIESVELGRECIDNTVINCIEKEGILVREWLNQVYCPLSIGLEKNCDYQDINHVITRNGAMFYRCKLRTTGGS